VTDILAVFARADSWVRKTADFSNAKFSIQYHIHPISKSEDITVKSTALATSPAISTLIQDDPFLARMDELQQSIARRAFELFQSSGFTNGHDLEDWLKAESELLQPVPLEVSETDNEVTVRAAVPGFTEKELQVKVDAHRVCIAGKREESSEQKKGKNTYAERRSHEICREVDLPAEINPDEAKAELRDGVLEIRLAKRAPGKTTLSKAA
jgi:HSP20 family protein